MNLYAEERVATHFCDPFLKKYAFSQDTSANLVALSIVNVMSLQNSLTNLPSHKALGLVGSTTRGDTTVGIGGLVSL